MCALDFIVWSGASVRDVLGSVAKLCADFREVVPFRDDAQNWREDCHKLRVEHARVDGDGSVIASRQHPGAVDRLLAESRGHAELDSLCGELENVRKANYALCHDVKRAQQAGNEVISTTSDRDSVAFEVKGQLVSCRGVLTTKRRTRES